MAFSSTQKYIALGADHAGVQYKTAIAKYLTQKGYNVNDKGTYDTTSVDYPDFAHPVAELVNSGECDFGILICGSANGVAITANKHQGVRAALCWTKEIAALARQHNNANIVCIPARFTAEAQALEILQTFMNEEFEGGRHAARVDKIKC
jgi:ribose 5-phosphate isomerase B